MKKKTNFNSTSYDQQKLCLQKKKYTKNKINPPESLSFERENIHENVYRFKLNKQQRKNKINFSSFSTVCDHNIFVTFVTV